MEDIKNTNKILFILLTSTAIFLAWFVVFCSNLILTYWWLVSFMLISVVMFILEIKANNEMDVFSPLNIFLFTSFIFYILPAFFDKYRDDRLFNYCMFLVILSLLSFSFGYIRLKRFRKVSSVNMVFSNGWTVKGIYVAYFFLFPVSMLIFIYLIRSSAYPSLSSYIMNIWIASRETLSGKSYLLEIMNFPLMASFFLFADYFDKNNKFVFIMAVIMLMLMACLTLLITGGRGSILSPLFSIIIIKHYIKKRLNVKEGLIYGGIILAFLFTAGSARDYIQFRKMAVEDVFGIVSTESVVRYLFLHLSGIIYDVYKNIIKLVPSHLDYQYGFTYLIFIFKFIPRVFMPAKIQGASQIVMENLYPEVNDAFFAPSYLGEFYLNFGTLGVVFGAFIFGAVFRWLYSFLQKHQNSKFAVILYALLIPGLIFEMRGDFGTVTAGMIMGFVKFILMYFLIMVFGSYKKQVNYENCD